MATAAQQREREIVISVPADKTAAVASFDPADFDRPTGREEQWRFTPMRRISDFFTPFAICGFKHGRQKKQKVCG